MMICYKPSGSRRPRRFPQPFWLLILLAAGCRATPLTPNPALAPVASLAPLASATAPPIPTPTPNPNWLTLAPGFERREWRVSFPEGYSETVIAFRVDPAQYRFRVLYAPTQPALVSQWERSARLVFNAGFFDENNVALGLLVSDGQFFGQSYVGLGGMFSVAGNVPNVRSLIDAPYQPGEALEQAVQSFPTLLRPDGTVFANEDGARARRTAIALDGVGRVLVFIASRGGFTLAQLAVWLKDSDLGLTAALNLDGGGSTGYAAGPNDSVDSFTPVPAVIAVYDR